MRYDPDRHHRHSIRMDDYDYSKDGVYFVTICIHNRERLLCEICDGMTALSEIGRAVEDAWNAIAKRFPFVVLDDYVLMPNHLHGILVFVEADKPDKTDVASGEMKEVAANAKVNLAKAKEGAASSAPTGFVDLTGEATPKVALGGVLRAFKSLSAIAANRLLDRAEQPFWQRNYHERIVRDEQEMDQVRTYIYHNPLQWSTDTENPKANRNL